MKITSTSLTLNQLFSSTNEQYVIPAYQRRYSWHHRQVEELLDDIVLLEEADTHLLGNIVCLTESHNAGINQLELVDGQQRLTTISILLICIQERLKQENNERLAEEVERLLWAETVGGKVSPKVMLDSIDSEEFACLARDEGDREYKNKNLKQAFDLIRGRLDVEAIDDVVKFVYRLRHQALVVRLDVSEAKDAFKLFETINNRGLRLSPTDIIKNFVLGNAARFGDEPLGRAKTTWTRLLRSLDGTSSDAFFRYFLTAHTNRRITKSQVVLEFKQLFMTEVVEAKDLPERTFYFDEDEDSSDDTETDDGTHDDENDQNESGETAQSSRASNRVSFDAFLKLLDVSSNAYGELVLAKTGAAPLDRHLRNLRMIKAAQTYGYLMHLRVNGCSDKHFLAVLALTEAFLMRRHICRERANETEQLFAKLCAADPQDPVSATKAAYRESSPPDERFREDFENFNFTANLIDRARYCLEQFELETHGTQDELQVLGSDAVHVEHIIPQRIKTKKAKKEFGDWVTYLGDGAEQKHRRLVSRIGNLTLFAGSLNIGASNNPFSKKKAAYKESAILITRELLDLRQFKFKQLKLRSENFASEAVKLWPVP